MGERVILSAAKDLFRGRESSQILRGVQNDNREVLNRTAEDRKWCAAENCAIVGGLRPPPLSLLCGHI